MFNKGTKVAINSVIRECSANDCPCRGRNCIDLVERKEDRNNGEHYMVTLKFSGKRYDSRGLTASESKMIDKDLVGLARRSF